MTDTERQQITGRVDDSFRTRIAAAIMESCHGVYLDDAVTAADAVIADLDSRGWLIDPESEDRRRRARNKRWLEGDDDHD